MNDDRTPHWVKVRLYYTDEGTPWKWGGECICGWRCMSWSWSREWDQLTSGLTREEYLAEGNSLEGGALVMALHHVRLYIPATT